MNIKKCERKAENNKKIFENVSPIKLTEGRRIKLHTEGWGLLAEYYLESVKITWTKTGESKSVATLKVGDRSGHTVCVVRGPTVGHLFGLSSDEWREVEKMCDPDHQLFYRYFKEGLSKKFGFEQKLFYNFCMSAQKTDVLVAVFRRCVNMRKKDKSDAFLEILELKKCDNNILDLYVEYLQKNVEFVL